MISNSDGKSREEKTSKIRLTGIGLLNMDSSDHEVDIVATIDGEVKHWEVHDLEGNVENQKNDNYGTIEVGPANEAVSYTVAVQLDGKESEVARASDGIQWNARDLPDKDPPCGEVRVIIDRGWDLDVQNWETKCDIK